MQGPRLAPAAQVRYANLGTIDVDTMLEWLDATRDLKSSKLGPKSKKKWAKILCKATGMTATELADRVSDVRQSSLLRARPRFDCTAMLMFRELFNAISPFEPSIYICVDGSPSGAAGSCMPAPLMSSTQVPLAGQESGG